MDDECPARIGKRRLAVRFITIRIRGFGRRSDHGPGRLAGLPPVRDFLPLDGKARNRLTGALLRNDL